MQIGTAGWAITREVANDGTHLQRYAQVLGCAEINSSFHRSHQRGVYERWASSTPAAFRFAVKVPRTITHEARLRSERAPLRTFLDQVAGLGERLAVLLVQLPPSFAFEASTVRKFFRLLRESFDGAVVCEPRHVSWFTVAVDRDLVALGVGRAAADPAAFQRPPDRAAGWVHQVTVVAQFSITAGMGEP